MKKYFLSIVMCALVSLVLAQEEKKESHFGAKFDPANALDVSKVNELLKSNDTVYTKLTGKITSVCQKKGCWMLMETGNGNTLRVKFKDYDFFVPKDAAGKTAVIEGMAFNDVTTVEMLQHYAEDANKSKEEIAKITQPEINAEFESSGVIIYND